MHFESKPPNLMTIKFFLLYGVLRYMCVGNAHPWEAHHCDNSNESVCHAVNQKERSGSARIYLN